MNIIKSLQAISAYPIPTALVLNAIEAEGLDAEAEADGTMRQSAAYKRTAAKVYRFLATAPNVSQGGISYSFSSDDKAEFRRMASKLSEEAGDEGNGFVYGYIGENF